MLRFSRGIVGKLCFLSLLFSLVANFTWAQSETATVSGQVADSAGLNIAGAQVKLVDIDLDTAASVSTNSSGLYTFPSVRPGRYRMEISAAGFRTVNVTGLTVNVQDHLEQNFKLTVGSVSESITVQAGAPSVDTESATVSTVVDRNFAENLPMNGRSFQTLIELTPGVVLTSNNGADTGQFSINGQRASSNYWMVDGVSANIGINAGQNPGNGMGGAAGSSSILGGTNSLVSVDALQEFRIQTSTFAPEFGRTPGGQISIVTRSGTNQFHGTAFDYVRNDIFDANNWFNGYTNKPSLPKAQERQNDFGGTLSGPIVKDRAFFFFSYEGLRLRLPQTLLTMVPDLLSRQNASAVVQPFLNAFPRPNGPDDSTTNVAQYNGSFSNPARLDAYSLRIDHRPNNRLALFGRYDYSPSRLSERGVGTSLSTVLQQNLTTQTVTMGATSTPTATAANDFRVNYSDTDASSAFHLDNIGGAVPLATFPFPDSLTTHDALFALQILSLGNNGSLSVGPNAHNLQRQINLVDNVLLQRGEHALKFGVDFRRLSPSFDPSEYSQGNYFLDVPFSETGTTLGTTVTSSRSAILLFRNLGVFAQDTWHAASRLTLTYGVRWDIDFVPSSISGPSFNRVNGFDLSNLSNLALAPGGTPYGTSFDSIAPRMGLAYQLNQSSDRQTVLRGGVGIFYDLVTSEAGNILSSSAYPFGSSLFVLGSAFPSATPPPAITPPNATNGQTLYAFDPSLKPPRTFQWNVAIERSLGKEQTVTASYIGSLGRKLLQTAFVAAPNPRLSLADLVTNAGNSDYEALQLQFQRRLSHRLQALASYSWAHSIDTGSAGSPTEGSNALLTVSSNVNRGPSDFDHRNAFSCALTYEVPARKRNVFADSFLRGWSTESVIQAQSAPPVDVYYSGFSEMSNGFFTNARPNIVVGQPLYLYGPQYPGRKALNAAAFAAPPLDATTGLPSAQGNLPRNALRGFGVTQWDFAIHRNFPIHESMKLQFRAELFNLLNHPNFGPPVGDLYLPTAVNPLFGVSTQMLGQSLSGSNLGAGALSPLYQLGGPRSIQFAVKLSF